MNEVEKNSKFIKFNGNDQAIE